MTFCRVSRHAHRQRRGSKAHFEPRAARGGAGIIWRAQRRVGRQPRRSGMRWRDWSLETGERPGWGHGNLREKEVCRLPCHGCKHVQEPGCADGSSSRRIAALVISDGRGFTRAPRLAGVCLLSTKHFGVRIIVRLGGAAGSRVDFDARWSMPPAIAGGLRRKWAAISLALALCQTTKHMHARQPSRIFRHALT